MPQDPILPAPAASVPTPVTATFTAPPPDPKEDAVTKSKIWEWVQSGLTIAVIPLVGWVINLSVENALRDERITQLQAETRELQDQEKEIQAVKDDLQKANIQITRLEGKIDLANGRLDEIKTLLGH